MFISDSFEENVIDANFVSLCNGEPNKQISETANTPLELSETIPSLVKSFIDKIYETLGS